MNTDDTIKEVVAVAAAATKETDDSGATSSDYTTSSKVLKNKQKSRSRLGCISCKKSKVKCDEKQPKCSRCSKSGRECVYPVKLAVKKIQEAPSKENTATKYYGVIAKYSDIPVSDQTKEYILKSHQSKSLSFVQNLVNKVNICQNEYKNFDDVFKAIQNSE
ncbi:hypothetical protein CANINC_000340 [Pichia inconspicua]|uniref:Zn(2)-C6 fungal-type domain-containing protein n=1 Tax=Pichia inconspicua TaxID=52247 RepID=A0A4T0X6F1_9ASCO|nr:hypothetical protein CANINC_000340 [[Candida] inconspicua]